MEVHSLSPETLQDTVAATSPTPIAASEISSTFSSNSIDLLSAPLGTKILSITDEFFAAAQNLLTPTAPISRPGVFVESGAWYDGWETRRHNTAPFDAVVFRLGVASGLVRGVEIDTAFFNGNHAPAVSVEGAFLPTGEEGDKQVAAAGFAGWEEILPMQECGPTQRQAWAVSAAVQRSQKSYTHIRLRMYPDGGIARFRLYGSVVPVFPPIESGSVLDLAATVNGGVATSCSDQHFGGKDNLLLPGRGKDMGDGWETKRTRGVHVDWVVVRLGAPGEIEKLVVDTMHFRGNFPQKVQIFAAEGRDGEEAIKGDDHERWIEILSPQPCAPDKEHEYDGKTLVDVVGKSYGWVKMVIIPDGGVKRLRVFGRRR